MEKREFTKNYEYLRQTIRIRKEIYDSIVNYNPKASFSGNLDDMICDLMCRSTDTQQASQIASKGKTTRTTEEKKAAKAVKAAYQASYETRYGIDPTWAAKENKLVYDLISRVGKEQAFELASKYPNYNDPFHVKAKHPFALLVSQVDKVRVELNDPRRMLDSYSIDMQAREITKSEVEKNVREQRKKKLLEQIEKENKQQGIEHEKS